MSRGGAREGAGRPPVPKSKSKALPTHSYRGTKEEHVLLMEYLKQLRNDIINQQRTEDK
jgi:hypothetical protein